MTSARNVAEIGKTLLVIHRTVHIDRAGETASHTAKIGEIVALDPRSQLVAVTARGEHFRCPVSRIYRAPKQGCVPPGRARPLRADYIAGEELIRDFHSGYRPVSLRWLDRRSVHAMLTP